jgi:hypothetical protein
MATANDDLEWPEYNTTAYDEIASITARINTFRYNLRALWDTGVDTSAAHSTVRRLETERDALVDTPSDFPYLSRLPPELLQLITRMYYGTEARYFAVVRPWMACRALYNAYRDVIAIVPRRPRGSVGSNIHDVCLCSPPSMYPWPSVAPRATTPRRVVYGSKIVTPEPMSKLADIMPPRPVVRRHACAICAAVCTKRCRACREVYYCCREHQTEHWPFHRTECC